MAGFTDDNGQALAIETRQLDEYGGGRRDYSATPDFWQAYEFVLAQRAGTMRGMVHDALKQGKAKGLPFELMFPLVVAERHDEAMRKAEVRIRVIEEALLKARIAFTRDFRRAAAST